MDKQVLAIVVTYNRKKLLLECIEALRKQTYKNLKILIVNNNSTDDTQEAVENLKIDNLEIVNTGKNIGGAGGFNYGLRYGYEHYDSFYYWLMDDDTIPSETALKELMNASVLLNDDFGFLSSKVLWTDGTLCKMNGQTVQDEKWIKDCDLIYEGLVRIIAATFVSCLFKRECVEKVGLPIKEFFIWNDDTEYTKRIIRKYNEKSFFVGKSIVTHKMKTNDIATVFDEKDIKRIDRQFYNYRNKFYIDKQNGIKGFFKGAIRCIKWTFLSIFKGTHRVRRTWAMIRAFWAGIFFNPKVEYVNEKEK